MPTDNPNPRDAENDVFENLGLLKEELGAGDVGNIEEGAGDSGFDDSQQETESQTPPEQAFGDDDRDADLRPPKPAKDDLQRRPEEPRQPFQNAPVKPDKQGNLRDAQGNIVARAGKEARLYTNAHKARAEAQRVTAERDDVIQRLEKAVNIGQDMYRELEAFKARDEQVKQFGLEPHEHLDAVQLAAEAKRDPMGTIKKLLTRAAANGIDLTQLGMQPGGVDAKSLMEMIRGEIAGHMKPVQDRAAQEKAEAEARAEQARQLADTQAEVNRFFIQNPNAREYAPVIQEVLKQPAFQHMSLGEVWARIQLNLVRNPPRAQNRRQPSLPNGRPRPMERSTQRNSPVSPDVTYDEMLRDILRETP